MKLFKYTILVTMPLLATASELRIPTIIVDRGKSDMAGLVNRAFEANQHLKSLDQAIEVKSKKIGVSFANFLPSASSSFSGAQAWGSDTTGHKKTLSFSGAQTIFDLVSAQDLRIAKGNHELAKINKSFGNDTVRADVENKFMAAWLMRNKDEDMKALRQSAAKLFEQEKLKARLGLISRTEMLNATATYANNIKTVQQYENDLDTAFVALEKATGLTLRSTTEAIGKYPDLTWNLQAEIKCPSLDSCLLEAFIHRKELASNAQEANTAKHYEQYYARGYLPTVGLYGSYCNASDEITYANDDWHTSKEIGIKANWSFFDGLSNWYNAQAYKADTIRLQEDGCYLKQQIQAEVTTAHHDLAIALRDLNVAQATLLEQKQLYEQHVAEHTAGMLGEADFFMALTAWQDARYAWLTKRVAATIAERALSAKCGF